MCDHNTSTYVHTSEDGTTTVVTYCITCGMEWR